MARYFLHLRDGTDELLDPEGAEVSSVDALKTMVLRCARDTMSHDLKTGQLELKWRIDAQDESGQVVYSLPFAGAVKITNGDLVVVG